MTGDRVRKHESRSEGAVGYFDQFENEDVRALVEEFPLAWVCGGPADAMEASLLPLIGEYDADGRLVTLIGHLRRANPLYRALGEDGRATILFKGPDAYVSPEHAGLRNWGPTWNYAQVKIGADIVFDDALTEMSLNVLVAAMETGRPAPWDSAELGDRYHTMLKHIIGFRASVTRLSGVFKLGQDERDEILASILGSLPDAETAAWMRRFNRHRIP